MVQSSDPGITKVDLDQALREMGADKSELILEIVKDLQNKFHLQQKMLTKLVSFVSKMYHDGEINKDTFNKLDEFLKPYYDEPYQD